MSHSRFARIPNPPYYAVIFTSRRTEGERGYGAMAEKMVALAAEQPGFLVTALSQACKHNIATAVKWPDLLG